MMKDSRVNSRLSFSFLHTSLCCCWTFILLRFGYCILSHYRDMLICELGTDNNLAIVNISLQDLKQYQEREVVSKNRGNSIGFSNSFNKYATNIFLFEAVQSFFEYILELSPLLMTIFFYITLNFPCLHPPILYKSTYIFHIFHL